MMQPSVGNGVANETPPATDSEEYDFVETTLDSNDVFEPTPLSRETYMAMGVTTRCRQLELCQQHHSFKPQFVHPYNWLEEKNEEFIWRDQMNDLYKRMSQNNVLVIRGPEGQGKNSLVHGYMRIAYHRMGDVYSNGLYWVIADNKESVRRNFAKLASHIGIPDHTPRNLDGLAEDVCEWLEHHDKWIIVFHGANTEDILKQLHALCGNRRENGYIIPQNKLNGHVIIMTNCDMGVITNAGFSNIYEIQPLTNEMLKDFILNKLFFNDQSKQSSFRKPQTREMEAESQALDHLVEMCDGFPITAAWICCVYKTQELVEKSFRNLLERVNEHPTVLNTSQRDKAAFGASVLFTWLERMVRQESNICGLILDLAATCHSINIPVGLFSKGVLDLETSAQNQSPRFKHPLEHLINGLRKEGEIFLINELKKGQNIGGLYDFQATDGDGHVMHVHAAVQNRFQIINNPHRKELLKLHAQICKNFFGQYSGNIKMGEQILSHAESCIEHMKKDLNCLIRDQVMLDLYVSLIQEVATCYLICFNLDAANRAANRLQDLLYEARIQRNTNYNSYRANFLYIKGLVFIWKGKDNGIGILKEAEKLFSKEKNKANQQQLCRTYTWIAFALIEREKLTEARKYLRLAEQLKEKLDSNNDPLVYRIKAHIRCQRGKLFKHQAYKAVYMDCNIKASMPIKKRKEYTKNLEIALQLFKEAVEWGTKCEGEYRCDMYRVLACEMEGKISLEKEGKNSESFKTCAIAMRGYLKEVLTDVGPYHRFTVRVKTKLAWMLLKLGDKTNLQEALALINQAIDLQFAICGSTSQPKMGELLFYKGQVLLALGERICANDCFEQARLIFTTHEKHIRLPRVLLMQVYAQQYDVDDVIRRFECKNLYNRMQSNSSTRRRHKSCECY